MSTKYISKILLGIAVVSALISCGGSGETDGNLSDLKARKDSLKEVKNLVATQLSDLEKQIQLLDTGSGRNIPLVTVETLKETFFKHYFEVQGVIETDRNTSINSEVAGNVLSIEVSEGSMVRKGQLLIKLDSKVIESNVNEVKTQLELAQTLYDKQKSLWDQQIGSEVAYLEAKSNLESMKNRLETLKSQLNMYSITAPFDGMVDEIYPKVGEMASPMAPMIRLLNLEHVYIKADVSERYLSKINVGDTAIIEIPSLGFNINSAISRIGSYINPNNRTFKVRFDFANSKNGLKPNLLAKIKIMDYSKSKSMVVPTKVIQENPNGDEFVFVLTGDAVPTVKKQIVKTGMAYQGMVEVTEGLQTGDVVIAQGGKNLKDGDLVKISSN